jgi:RES domain-containing protein
MKAFRLTRSTRVNSAFTGDGSRKYGGRWNSPGQAIVYTSSTLSLAVLEIMAHLDDYTTLSRSYSFIPVEIPSVLITAVDPKSLPAGWNEGPPGAASQHIGDSWVSDKRSAVLAVPTVLVPDEVNYLINPNHPDFPRISIGAVHKLFFDPRFTR